MTEAVVSVVTPCYNEERYILKALEPLTNQYGKDCYEIIVVDGASDDRTRERIEAFRRKHTDVSVRLVEDPARNNLTALNLGIAASRGASVARTDAHAVLGPGYIRRCIEVSRTTDAAVVGM